MSDLEASNQAIQLNRQVGHLTAGTGGLTGARRALDRKLANTGQILVDLAGHLRLHNGTIISGRKRKRSRLTLQKLTQQKGISYDPKTFHNLGIEAARRDAEREERVRIYYLALRAKNRSPVHLSFKARQQKELEDTIRSIIALILACSESGKQGARRQKRRRAALPASLQLAQRSEVKQEEDLNAAWFYDRNLAL